MNDLMGKKFNKLTVIKYAGKPGKKHRWICKCDCGNETNVQENHLLTNNTKSCGCLHKLKGNKSPSFRGCGEIPLDFFGKVRRGAKSRNHKLLITIQYIWKLFLKQNRKCALSSLPLSFDGTASENKFSTTNKTTASLDRIDSSKGYVKGNVQWVHKDINLMKNTLDNEKFLYYCKMINENQPK